MENGIYFMKGDATVPSAKGNKVIVHICNDIGRWGKGFVMAISKRWPEPERKYREWYKLKQNFALGSVQYVEVETDTWVANVIGQHKINKDEYGNPPIRYEAVFEGLTNVSNFAIEKKASIHMPRIGCGLAGGSWDKIEDIVIKALVNHGISVIVYDF